MPKQAQSKVTGILNFFRSQPLEVAELVFGLVRDEMKDRRANVLEPTAKVGTPQKRRGPKPGFKRAKKAEALATPPVNEATPLGGK